MVKRVQAAVIVSSSASACSGLVLAVACGIACFIASREARGPSRFVQWVLANLGLADFFFASSFLLAQFKDNASESGGATCFLAAIMNEYAGVVSALWTAALAWTLHGAIVHGHGLEYFWGWRRYALLTSVWGVPALIELLLVITTYLPQHLIGPEQHLPWCHWRKDAVDFSMLLYSVVVASASWCAACYCSVRDSTEASRYTAT